ncbi:MAG TPA: hypothetical protein VFF39_08285, partial [Verrucomicrobiae bacterium]|nr:hypothetical protein [Verrucomicrobiae bacterium]
LLREVRAVLAERFPSAEIRRAADPKECVVLGACLWRSLARGKNLRLVLPSGSGRTTSQIGLLDEDGIFYPYILHDQQIPEGGLQVEIPSAWEGQDRIVLWENLGVENCRVRPDKSLNPLISRLGAWEPVNSLPPCEHSWSLRLCLYSDFSFKVMAFSGNRLVELRPVQGQR